MNSNEGVKSKLIEMMENYPIGKRFIAKREDFSSEEIEVEGYKCNANGNYISFSDGSSINLERMKSLIVIETEGKGTPEE